MLIILVWIKHVQRIIFYHLELTNSWLHSGMWNYVLPWRIFRLSSNQNERVWPTCEFFYNWGSWCWSSKMLLIWLRLFHLTEMVGYYVIFNSKHAGIYMSWGECSRYVLVVRGPRYKKYSTLLWLGYYKIRSNHERCLSILWTNSSPPLWSCDSWWFSSNNSTFTWSW